MNRAEFETLAAEISPLRQFAYSDFEITSLPGYTNRNYRLKGPQQDWVLRIPRAETNCYIDRIAERHNQQLVQQLQLAPRITWSEPGGISLTPTLTNSHPLRAQDFGDRRKLHQILEPIQRLHRSGLRFHGRVDLRAVLTRQFELLGKSEQAAYRPRMAQAETILKRIETGDPTDVPSHNDLVLDNLLWQGSRLWIIDWEYSSMASPYWDLATLCNAADLSLEQSRLVLSVYCAGAEQMEQSRLLDYRDLLKLLSDCWMATLAAD